VFVRIWGPVQSSVLPHHQSIWGPVPSTCTESVAQSSTKQCHGAIFSETLYRTVSKTVSMFGPHRTGEKSNKYSSSLAIYVSVDTLIMIFAMLLAVGSRSLQYVDRTLVAVSCIDGIDHEERSKEENGTCRRQLVSLVVSIAQAHPPTPLRAAITITITIATRTF
jgi:hypothetical protein